MIRDIISLISGHNEQFRFTTDQVMKAFKQGTVDLPLRRSIGGGGNCASVALIKAAIATFGIANVFKSITIDERNKRYIIDLQDDDEILFWLPFDDYKFGADRSAFRLMRQDEASRTIFEFSKFCFAVMAEVKRTCYRRRKNYERAVHDLNKGESTADIYEYLGLNASELTDLSIGALKLQSNLVVWNPRHAVFCSLGMYDEFFEDQSEIEPIEKLQIIHGDGTSAMVPVGAYKLQ